MFIHKTILFTVNKLFDLSQLLFWTGEFTGLNKIPVHIFAQLATTEEMKELILSQSAATNSGFIEIEREVAQLYLNQVVLAYAASETEKELAKYKDIAQYISIHLRAALSKKPRAQAHSNFSEDSLQ